MENPLLLQVIGGLLIISMLVVIGNADRFDRFFAKRVIMSVTRITVIYSCTLRCRCEEWEYIRDRILEYPDIQKEVAFAKMITDLMDAVRVEIHRSEPDSTHCSKLRLCHDALIGWDERVREAMVDRLYYRQYTLTPKSIGEMIDSGLREC